MIPMDRTNQHTPKVYNMAKIPSYKITLDIISDFFVFYFYFYYYFLNSSPYMINVSIKVNSKLEITSSLLKLSEEFAVHQQLTALQILLSLSPEKV